MSKKKSILVGVDYSTHSKNALREAARIANSSDLSLFCYHVLDGDILEDFRKMEAYTEEGVLNFAREKMDAFIRDSIGTAHDIHSIVTIGHAFEETLKLIEEHNVETLILGSRGFSSDEPQHVGALASRCIRKAPAEVLLVRNFQDHPFQRIVACVDFSDTSNRAVHRAAELARQDKARLRLIHVFRPPVYADSGMGWLGPSLPIIPDEDLQANLKERLERLSYEIGKEYDLRDLTTDVISSHSIHHGIYEELKEANADLVVLGTRGRTGFKKLLLGTTAEGLINKTPCSALAVKPADFHFSLH